MPSNQLILCCPLLLLASIFPSIRVFYSESALCIRGPKYWSFSFSNSPSNDCSGLISLIDWFDLLAAQGMLKSLLQHHSSKASVLRCSVFFMDQLSHPSNLPWFMDQTFQVPKQYCSLQHQTFLLPPDTSTAERHFCFGTATSFILELLEIALHSCPVAYCTPSYLGGSSPGVISFCLFILSMGLSRQEYWSGLPFSPPVDRILSELFTVTHPSWVALPGMADSTVEL